jgi:histone H3/H4
MASWSATFPLPKLSPVAAPAGPEGARVGKPKKKRRFRPGTRAAMEIRREQRSMVRAIRRQNFVDLVRDIMQRVSAERGEPWRVSRGAFDLLGEESERFLETLMRECRVMSTTSRRETIMTRDLDAVLHVVRHLGSYATLLQPRDST